MPLPTPETGESEDDFLGRCMSSDDMQAEFPEQDQRAAVCFRQFRGKEAGDQANYDPKEMRSVVMGALYKCIIKNYEALKKSLGGVIGAAE